MFYQSPPRPPLPLQRGHPLGCTLWLYGMYLTFGLCWTVALAGQAWGALSSGHGNMGYLTDFLVILWLFAVPGLGLPVLYRVKRLEWDVPRLRLWPGVTIILGLLVVSVLFYWFPVLGRTVSVSVDLAFVLALLTGLVVAFVRLRPTPPSETSGTPTFDEMKQFHNQYKL